MNKFKMALIVCWLLNFIFFSGTESASANSIDSADIEIFMDKMMQEKMKEQHIPNVTVSVVSNGKVILEKGYGYANVEDQTGNRSRKGPCFEWVRFLNYLHGLQSCSLWSGHT